MNDLVFELTDDKTTFNFEEVNLVSETTDELDVNNLEEPLLEEKQPSLNESLDTKIANMTEEEKAKLLDIIQKKDFMTSNNNDAIFQFKSTDSYLTHLHKEMTSENFLTLLKQLNTDILKRCFSIKYFIMFITNFNHFYRNIEQKSIVSSQIFQKKLGGRLTHFFVGSSPSVQIEALKECLMLFPNEESLDQFFPLKRMISVILSN